MGDHLRTGIPPRYVTKPTRWTQPCTDPIWHVSFHSSEACCKLLYTVTVSGYCCRTLYIVWERYCTDGWYKVSLCSITVISFPSVLTELLYSSYIGQPVLASTMHPELRTRGFCWCRVLLSAYFFWLVLLHFIRSTSKSHYFSNWIWIKLTFYHNQTIFVYSCQQKTRIKDNQQEVDIIGHCATVYWPSLTAVNVNCKSFPVCWQKACKQSLGHTKNF